MYRKIFLDANILVDSTDAQRSGHLFKIGSGIGNNPLLSFFKLQSTSNK